MGAFSTKEYIKFSDKNIGNSGDNWDAKTCPAAYNLTGAQCSQQLVSSANGMLNCTNLANCKGFDWDPNTNIAYYHQQANPNNLTEASGKEAFIYESKTNWALIVAIIFGVIVIVLFIIFLFIAMHHHVKNNIASGKLPPEAAGNLIGT